MERLELIKWYRYTVCKHNILSKGFYLWFIFKLSYTYSQCNNKYGIFLMRSKNVKNCNFFCWIEYTYSFIKTNTLKCRNIRQSDMIVTGNRILIYHPNIRISLQIFHSPITNQLTHFYVIISSLYVFFVPNAMVYAHLYPANEESFFVGYYEGCLLIGFFFFLFLCKWFRFVLKMEINLCV